MKFLSIAVAAVLGAMGAAEGKKKISSQEMKSRIQKGQFNSRTLMRSAKPYGKTARKLEEANNGDANEEQQEWQINGLYSVQFSKCLSMTYQDEDLFDENFISYAQDGLLIAEKSFILFTACQSDDCYYQSDEDMTFITDIASFFQAFADFLPNQVENYCEGCNQNYDYCMGTLDAQQEGYGADDAVADDAAADDGQEDAQQEDNNGEEDQQDENQDQEAEGEDQGDQQEDNGEQDNGEQDNAEGQDNGEGEDGDNANEGGRKLSKVMDLPFRKLANNNNQVIQMIDCDMCNAYECFQADEEQANGDDAADDAVVYEFEDALNWLDGLTQCQQMEEATYNDMALYSGLICNSDGTGVEIGIFMDEECTLYAPKLSFGSMMSYSDSMYFSMSEEVVEYMFTNDFSCYQPDVQYTNPYEYEEQEEDANGDDQAEDEPEAAEWCANLFNGNMEAVNLYDCGYDQNAEQNDQDADQEYDENLDYYSWYSYQLSQDQVDDGTEVCMAVKNLNGGYTTLYDKTSGGTLYNYKKNWGNSSNSKNGMRPGGVATLIIFIVLASAGAAAYFVKSKKGGDKRAPLLGNADGTMA